jgi:UrcA family protein
MFRLLVSVASLACLLLLLSAIPAAARDTDEMVTVRLRHVVQPSSAAEAEHLLDRIETAQAEACGASTFSLPDYRQAIRRGACWREGVTRTVAEIGNPLLRDALAHRYRWRS